jgi:hypothetical protein
MRAEWFLKVPYELLELIHCEASGLACSFCRPSDRYQFHRITLDGHLCGPHCQVPQLTNQGSDVDAAFRRQVQTVEPQLYRTRL